MVADFVDEDMGDEVGEGDVAAIGPFVEDRAAVEKDDRWLGRGIVHRAMGEIDALIEARQFERVLDVHLGKHIIAGEILDANEHVARQRTEAARHLGPRGAREGFDVVERGRQVVRGHGLMLSAFLVFRDGGYPPRRAGEVSAQPTEGAARLFPPPTSLRSATSPVNGGGWE